MIDTVIEACDAYKMATIGDAYMIVGGLPSSLASAVEHTIDLDPQKRHGKSSSITDKMAEDVLRLTVTTETLTTGAGQGAVLDVSHDHALDMCHLSLAILNTVQDFVVPHLPEKKLQMRIGLHSGPVVGAVVGRKAQRYCLFGTTVDIANRMESTGAGICALVLANKIQISKQTKMALDLAIAARSRRRSHQADLNFDVISREKKVTNSRVPVLPVEVIERILLETVLAQAYMYALKIGDRAIKKNDENLAAVCPLWEQILHERQFREILCQRLAKIDNKALYKQQAAPVKIRGVSAETSAVATLKDKLYTIETPQVIFVYDMQISDRLPGNNYKDQLEVLCTNKRQLPATDGLCPMKFVSSHHENCLFVASEERNTDACKMFKLASEGSVLVSWNVRTNIQSLAIDPFGSILSLLPESFS